MIDQATHIANLLERLGTLLRGVQRHHASGLQPVHLQVLDYLERANRYSDGPAAVAEYLGLTKGTVSQSIRVLEEKGLVQRRGEAADGRRSHLRLTVAGRRQLTAASVVPLLESTVTALGPDSANLITQLEALLRGLQLAQGGRSFGQCQTCRHFQTASPGQHRCGLTGERLSVADAQLICREHEVAL